MTQRETARSVCVRGGGGGGGGGGHLCVLLPAALIAIELEIKSDTNRAEKSTLTP